MLLNINVEVSFSVVSNSFQYLIKLFPKLSYAKIKEGIFVGLDIRKVMVDAKLKNV